MTGNQSRKKISPLVIVVSIIVAGAIYWGFSGVFFGKKPEIPPVFSVEKDTFGLIDGQKVDISLGSGKLRAEVAKSEARKELGLGGRQFIGGDEAMLFVFAEADSRGMWMKDMNFPIDVIWLDDNFSAVDFSENISPETYPEIFEPSAPASFFLETAAGAIKKYGIKIGDEARFQIPR